MTKKKLKLIILTAIFILALIVLPFVVANSYKLGETITIISLPFSKGEILSYITAAMGVSISIVALFVAISVSNPDIQIKRQAEVEFIMDDKGPHRVGNIQQGLSITNKSPVEVSIVQIGFISKKKAQKRNKRLMAQLAPDKDMNFPIKIQPFDSVSVCYDSEKFFNCIYKFGKMMEENDCKTNDVIFYVKLACGEIFEFKSKDDCVFFEAVPKGDEKSEKNENADK